MFIYQLPYRNNLIPIDDTIEANDIDDLIRQLPILYPQMKDRSPQERVYITMMILPYIQVKYGLDWVYCANIYPKEGGYYIFVASK